jgi:Arc/MetJ-type ribon-helix-helix transcriptional regulator
MKETRITIRLEKQTRQKIEQKIKDKKFSNMSKVIRNALKQFLEGEAEQ